MCGIVGILGTKPVALPILEALRRLEYRGYDSAGIATLCDGRIERRRAEGKLANLQAALERRPLDGISGIGHTRWATHGAPSESNAHPHATGRVAVVHNGIIENFAELRAELRGQGCIFESETDSEVIAHLITRYLVAGMTPGDATRETLAHLQGAFALALIFHDQPDLMIGARRGSPLAIGHGEGEMYLGSDAFALGPLTNKITYLEDGDWVEIRRGDMVIRDAAGQVVTRPMRPTSVAASLVDKGEHRHFMAKEIFEQPEVIGHTLAAYIDLPTQSIALPLYADGSPLSFANLSRLSIVGCGTAAYAALVGKYLIEKFARLPVEVDIASEFRYRESPLPRDGMALFISQSGETADTLAALRYCRAQGQKIVSIVNVAESSIARESDLVLPTHAGPEIGVASTKAFTCQLTVLMALAVAAGRDRGFVSAEGERAATGALLEIPRHVLECLALDEQIQTLGQDLAKMEDVLYLGRGPLMPIALEGALKLKEISYIHAEGYAAGELKHGPIALIDETVPVVVLAPHDALFEKTVSNMKEVAARGGRIILLSDQRGVARAGGDAFASLMLPQADPLIAPLLYAVPLQLLAYHIAVAKGTDVDQPRNLAKSVTVE
jgi:glucosamine--fructose-6-phosphate aminotransferase (isomerizing)